ncbi:MAG: UDP-N-acetylmuramoyl-L-alanyl-D-glutamate--2,6-diaminopimelate ligase [Fusobacteriaceae bacterium]
MEKVLKELMKNRERYGHMEHDSRKIEKDGVFVALKGALADGHKYIDKALKLGARAIIHSDSVEKIEGIDYYQIENLRENLGMIASEFYGYPQDKLKIVGITGTNGKTTVSYLVETILGKKHIARIGTVEYKIGDEIIEAPNTTPESLDLVKFCSKAVNKGIKYLVMEVSSHALMLGRVSMLKLDVASFTNLTPEHLDFHKTMEEYYNAKKKIFSLLKEDGKSVINIDDSYGERYYTEFGGISYGIEKGDLKGEYCGEKTLVKFSYGENESVRKIKLLGRYNLYNILTAVGIGISLGVEWETIMDRVEKMIGAPGRFEIVDCGQKFLVVVDYAHTGDALENLLKTVKDLGNHKIITVFGCGGERDRKKRPEMAKIAEDYSDMVIVTSDNPRGENVDTIIQDIKIGFKNPEKVLVETDREIAIRKAVQNAEKNSIIVLAGKGHESYQVFGNEKIHFDDREYLRREIVLRGYKEDI